MTCNFTGLRVCFLHLVNACEGEVAAQMTKEFSGMILQTLIHTSSLGYFKRGSSYKGNLPLWSWEGRKL